MRWKIGIALSLLLFVVVNGVFLMIALDNAPEIDASYEEEPR